MTTMPAEAGGPNPPFRGRSAPRMQIRNRQTAGLTFRADEWAAQKAGAQATARVRAWGYPHLDEHELDTAVRLLVRAAVADGGRRISVHLADQDHRILAVALSHVTGTAPDDGVLTELASLRSVVGCGTDAAADGRRLWVLLDADRPAEAAKSRT
ncbi:hypothetical protein AB0B01_15390 [Streptomyces sp. NPDC044571]|uniref:hypothetical protein n=1 Tax=Streptomyces sp. NPDC044571 TaxID=3155371 RepID=UPI003409626F